MLRTRPAVLVLETGETYEGFACGASGKTVGEVVFNTSMTGYQEVLTDPSYAGQLVVMTYPHIGNYGINDQDIESAKVQPAGFIMRELTRRASNFRSGTSLQDYLDDASVVGITGLDTRALTRRIRDGGAVMGIIAHDSTAQDKAELLAELRSRPTYGDIDFVAEVSVPNTQTVTAEPCADPTFPSTLTFSDSDGSAPASDHVVVLDYGVKYSILRQLLGTGLKVTLAPSSTPAEDILALSPSAILLSNGPGDPARLTEEVETVRELLGKKPVFGICLGHQILAQALGGTTFKLKYGHRGGNQPVKNCDSHSVAITSQNHGYAVSTEGLPEDVEITQINLNDGTVEGLRHASLDAYSVQYHPEAGPGPNDAAYFFDEIAQRVRQRAG